MKKRLLAIIMALALCLSLLPVGALADFSDVGSLVPAFQESIAWAVEKGVTSGYDDGTFRPNNTCTRGHVVTFLWRAEGEPEPKTSSNPFTDLDPSAYYYKAILWAVENGITSGYEDGTFRPNASCTRAHVVTFLWRYEGKPSASGEVKLIDLDGLNADFTAAIKWAATNDVTSGYEDGTFRPNAVCTRAHVVTFIYRDVKASAEAEKLFTVSFDANGGSKVADQKVKNGECAAKPADPTRSGHIFDGWYTAKNGGSKYDFSSKVTADVTLYAHWSVIPPTPTAPLKNDLTVGDAQKIADGVYKLSGGTYDDIIIPESIGNGDVTLEGVTVNGRLLVKGGGSDSIHLDSCTVDTIEVSKDVSAANAEIPRIDLINTPVETIEAVQPVIIEADEKSAVEQVEAKSNVTVQGDAAQISTIVVPETATQTPVIDVKAGSVGTVEANKPAEVKSSTGNGAVTNVEANAAVTVASEAVTTITVTVQVTVTVTGSAPVEVAVTAPVSVNIAAETESAVEITTTVETGVSVTVNEAPVAHIHKWTKTSETPAACETKGSVIYTCSGEGTCDLGGTKTIESAALGHDWATEFTVDLAATCTTVGSKSHHCSRCDAKSDVTEIPMLGHDYSTVTYTWAQTADGYTCTAERVCTRDNTHKQTETVKASYAVTKNAACETKGVGTYTATFTNSAFAQQIKNVELAALGHDYSVAQHDAENHWLKCSRCDAKSGVTAHSYADHSCDEAAACLGCGYVKPAGQHSYGAYSQTKAPTCTEKGSEHAFCANCSHEDVRELAALGHDWAEAFTIDTPATCTAAGSKSHHCSRCDAKSGVTEIPMLGHDYSVAQHDAENHWLKCSRCDAKSGVTAHSYAAHSCDEAAACLGCGYVKPAGQHSYGAYSQTKAPTCTGKGSEHAFCVNCSHEDVRELAALGHDWATEWISDGTQHWHVCQREGCGAISAKENHVPGAAATEDTPQTCTVCGYELAPATSRAVSTFDELTAAMETDGVKTVIISSDAMFTDNVTVPAGKTLIVPEGKRLQVSGQLFVYGTLTNNGSINGFELIDVFGGTLNNTGTIEGKNVENDHGGMDNVGLIAIEGGGRLDNFVDNEAMGTIKGTVNVVDYYMADGSCKISTYNMSVDDPFTVSSDSFELGAACFGTEAVKAVLEVSQQIYGYEFVILCGEQPGENTVELGGVTVYPGQVLVLKDEVFDGTNTYLNSYKISEGKTFTTESGAALVCVGAGSIDVKGRFADNGGFITFGDYTVSGLSIVGNTEELLAALDKDGDIYLLPFDDAEGEGEDRAVILNDRISIDKDVRLINRGAEPIFFGGGVDIGAGRTLALEDGMVLVLANDSTVSGTLEIGNNCTVLVRTPDEAGEVTELTVSKNGKIVIGGETCWGAVLCSADGNNRGMLVNNGTIDCYGDMWFEDELMSGSGTLILRSLAAVGSRDEFLAATEKSYVRNIIFVDDVTLESGDVFKGQGMSYEIPENVTVTLANTDENSPPYRLEQGADMRVYGKLIVDFSLCVYSGIWTPEDEPREDHLIINDGRIFYMKNFSDFGAYVREAVGDRLEGATPEDIEAFAAVTEDSWPFYDDYWNTANMAFLAKYGGVTVWQDEYNENRVFWPSWETITYGAAKDILSNVWKAINGEDSEMPENVCISWLMESDDMHDMLCNELVDAFIIALPRIEDGRTDFTLIRDNVNEDEENLSNDGMTLSGRTFTKHVTVTCDTQYLNGDGFGGTLNFVNCEFTQGVTVKMSDGVNYTVDFGNSCTGAVTVELPDGNTTEDCRFNGTNVEFFGINGMAFDTVTGEAFGSFNDWGHDETVSFTLNGLTITDEGEGAFGVDARYDENGRDEQNEPIFIPTVEVRIFAQANSVTICGEDYTGKLRISGNADVSELALGEGGFIEMGDTSGADIVLGDNEIFVNGNCGGEYSFTGTGRVIVRDHNMNARITVNGVDLGTPHIFGSNGDGIFFPLDSSEGIGFKVEQGYWDEENECDAWAELAFDIDQQEEKLHLIGREENPWIEDCNRVRVTVTVGGAEVVYDTIMWKPVSAGEFLELLNGALGTEYPISDFTENEWDWLNFGLAKQMLTAALKDYTGSEDEPDLRAVIGDENYWNELRNWEGSDDEFKENWNPDNWTWDWYFAFGVIDTLRSMLGIKETVDGDVTLHLIRDMENGFENVILNDGEYSFDGNCARNYRFTGTVTLVCDSNPPEYDDWGGCISFEDCVFENGIAAEVKQGANFGLRLRNCSDTKLTLIDGDNSLAPLMLSGTGIAADIRYDEYMRDEQDQPVYIPTIHVRDEGNEGEEVTAVTVGTAEETAFTGKLRVCGNVDLGGVSFGGDGFAELANDYECSNIALGGNEIVVNIDCGGEYSFTGTGRVIVRDHNMNARITVNGVDLGTPHIFGSNGDGIFFPLESSEGIDFKVEQGYWDEENECDAWAELAFDIDQQEEKLHLIGREENPWIEDCNRVRVTVTVGGAGVVYDTIMWKPISAGEFVQLINDALETSYTFSAFTENEWDYLNFGLAKQMLTAALKDYTGSEDEPDLRAVIDDENYWNELRNWEGSDDKFKDSWNPDNWTWDWYFAFGVIESLRSMLSADKVLCLVSEKTIEPGSVSTWNYEHDEHGNIVSGTLTDSSDTQIGTLTATYYDAATGCLEQTVRVIGELTETTVYDEYSHGIKTQTVADASGSILAKLENTYNDSGLIVKSVSTDNDVGMTATTEYTYNNEGQLIKEVLVADYGFDIIEELTTEYTYRNGLLSSASIINRDYYGNEYTTTVTYSYDQNGREIRRSTTITGGGTILQSLEVSFSYDADGNLIKQVNKVDSITVSSYDYSYTKFGDAYYLTKETMTVVSGGVEQVTTVEYTYAYK